MLARLLFPTIGNHSLGNANFKKLLAIQFQEVKRFLLLAEILLWKGEIALLGEIIWYMCSYSIKQNLLFLAPNISHLWLSSPLRFGECDAIILASPSLSSTFSQLPCPVSLLLLNIPHMCPHHLPNQSPYLGLLPLKDTLSTPIW